MSEVQLVPWSEMHVQTEHDLWLVPDMIANTSTLLYGESESGKSFLASALIASLTTGEPFLGRDPVGGPYRVTVAYTDDDGGAEYKTRIRSALADEDDELPVTFYRTPVLRVLRQWSDLRDSLRANGTDVLVMDNMTQAMVGDLNNHSDVRDFFEGVRMIVDAGIPVIVVGHSSQKTGQNGAKPDQPMGHSAIVQSVRWRVFARRFADDSIKLTFAGNAARKWDMTVDHGEGANFTVSETNSADDRMRKEQRRQEATRNEHEQMADAVVTHCQGVGFNATAKWLSETYGKGESTMKQQLSTRGLAGLLDRSGTGKTTRWERIGLAA